MEKINHFPARQNGRLYLSEGGIETEIMYKWGFELPQFAMFPLLENPKAVPVIHSMFRRYLDVVAEYKLCALIGGLDYRASPDWGALLGYSPAGLAEANIRSISFLREVASEYKNDIPEIVIQGLIGPRGDAYAQNKTIDANEAEDYHSVQLETLKLAEVDLALAITFNNIPEAIGVTRAARNIGVPLAISFTLNSASKLNTGDGLAKAIEMVDEQTQSAPEFYTVNCSHPVEYEPALVSGNWIKRLRGVRPNASKMEKIALCKLGHLEEGDPIELGQLCGNLASRYPHMDLWGGCCGTGDVHLREIAKNVLAAQE